MVSIWIAFALGLAAIFDDVAHRRISNWIPAAALMAGLGLQIHDHGWRGGLSGLAGALVGGSVLLIFYLMGGMGGGDIKLMAGFGAMLGAGGIIEASLWSAACGGLMAALVILFGGLARRRRALWPDPVCAALGNESQGGYRPDSIPYAPAIAAGVWLTLLAKP